MLCGRTKSAFFTGGSQWIAVSSRLLHARLKFQHHGTQVTWIHVLVCYALTFRSPRDKKIESYNQMQERIHSIPSNNHLVILGDFNVHVGQALSWKDAWSGTRGGYEIGVGE